ncbi:MAG: choice-of-anchor J domain-containing protein [Bacteroidales bacterium]|nr:choice-of-anchor J domain-containing protein [Bacteroidales bacterium]
MKKSLLILFNILFVSANIFAQSPEIEIHSFSPEVLETNKNIELNVTLINKGNAATENNITATLTSDNEYVTIIDGEASYGSLAPNETQEATFVIMLSELCPDKNDITFSLETVLEGSSIESKVSFDFEDGFQGWTSIDADGDGFKWISTTTKLGAGYGHESDFCVFSQSYDNTFDILYPDNYLVSPEKFKIGKDATFNFWACAQDLNYPEEHFGVAISTESNTSASDFTTIKEWNMTAKGTREQGNWYQYSVDLSDYEGQEIWIAIRHFDCYDKYFLVVDDIEVNNILQPKKWNEEISVKTDNPTPEIAVTTIQHDDIAAGKEININVTFVNNGSGASTFNTVATLTTNDEYVTVVEGEKILAPIECGEEITQTFIIKTEASLPSEHAINFDISILPENVSDNVISFNYGFEEDMNGWTTVNADGDDHTWYHATSANDHSVSRIASHSGKGHIMSESFCNTYMEAVTIDPNDYIVSPVRIGVTDSTTFSFWACQQDENYNEHFGVAISTAAAPTGDDFTTIKEFDIQDLRATEWKQYTADLSEYAGQYVWVAMRHFNSANNFVLCVDDANISNFVLAYNWGKSFILVSDETSIIEENIAFDIYPNPVNDRLYIETQTLTIEIYDVYGRIQKLRNSETQKLRNSIDVSNLKSGVYFVKVVTENGEAVQRFIKK